ncbi:Hypothetical protein HVPorG_04980 [Roseomonas mucosa]|nr:Hypothetical protein HVPorG_04980 [Roseomonas mucosa]
MLVAPTARRKAMPSGAIRPQPRPENGKSSVKHVRLTRFLAKAEPSPRAKSTLAGLTATRTGHGHRKRSLLPCPPGDIGI